MSVFIQQNITVCRFNSDNWAVLSSVEQGIKSKMETIGTPLKNWDISIYRGILTGYNDAFIIDGKKKDELIKQDSKSAEIIRPILRGRDIKRYGYEFANLYLICTFPSKHYNIDDYPAVRDHLFSFDKRILEQSGKKDIDGIKGKNARKKTNNKWFETQDSISYWDDFYRQKIVYIEIMTDNPEEGYSFPSFSFDNQGCVLLNTAYMMTGEIIDLKYILSILNSKLGRLLVKFYVTQLQNRQFRMLHQYVTNFPIPKISTHEKEEFNFLVDEILSNKIHGINSAEIKNQLDRKIYTLFNLNDNEIKFIECLT